MTQVAEHRCYDELGERLHDAQAVTAEIMSAVIHETCRRIPPIRRTGKAARLDRFIGSEAWTDAALALIDLEKPQWQVRRIAYDEGEWHCALSCQRELPIWLDQSIENHHADLALAILSAFIDAQRFGTPRSETSVPIAPREATAHYLPLCCDNFM
jgi:hypothetical protein